MTLPAHQRSLFIRYANRTATEAEINELMQWLASNASEEEIAALMDEAWSTNHYNRRIFDTATSRNMLQKALDSDKYDTEKPVVRRITFINRRSLAIAASIVVLLSAGLWSLLSDKYSSTPVITEQTAISQTDIAPAKDKAVLTLADGSTIILDDAADGALPSQEGAQVIKLDGQLQYNPNKVAETSSVAYNTITTPKGKQYMIILADGTKVWLNARSSIRFPIAFPETDRRVEINGEVYFEVAHQADKAGKKIPFHVAINTPSGKAGEIEVLGTHFNVSAYDDEPAIKTTLLEGSVQIKSNNSWQRLSPGQEARLPHPSSLSGDAITLIKDANTAQAIAWKNNLFDFDNETLPDVMRQLARWYDIDVVYEGQIPIKHYFGSARRQVNISEIFKMLEIAGGVEFRIEGKQVIVQAKQ